MQANPSGFSWYNSGSQGQPSQQSSDISQFSQSNLPQNDQQYNQPQSNQPQPNQSQFNQPQYVQTQSNQQYGQPQYDQRYNQPQYDQGVNGRSNFVIPNPNGNVYVEANNVIIQNAPPSHESGEGPIQVKTEGQKTANATGTSTGTSSGTASNSTSSSGTASNSTSHPSSDNNVLGIPSPHGNSNSSLDSSNPPSNTEHSTATSSKDPSNPLGIPAPQNSSSSAPAKGDGIHEHPLSTGIASDRKDTIPPLSSDHGDSTTMPANPPSTSTTSNSASTSTTPHTTAPSSTQPATTLDKDGKPHKEHKGIKQRLHDFKEHLGGHHGGKAADPTIHPKDSRDGRSLPSGEELSAKIGSGQGGPDKNAPALQKDKGDATGKTITGTDANISKASVPFTVPTPGLQGPPIDAKTN